MAFVFTNAAPILVLLFYRCCKGEGKDRKRYLILLLTFFLSISVCFLYFEFASHSSGREIYDEVVAEAKSLSQDGESYNPSILSHEILGEDVFLDEWELHLENYREFPAFLVLGLPYLLIFYFFAKRVIKGESGWKRLPYLAFLIGVITILPEMILKVDYGRYMCITFVYYIAMTMVFLTMEDAPVTRAIEGSKSYLRDHLPIPGMVILYSIFFTPMFDVVICWAAYRLSAMVLGL